MEEQSEIRRRRHQEKCGGQRHRRHHGDAMQYPDNEFDAIVCNHVLEHVQEDAKGMAECFRVLKPGGIGIFSVPMDVNAEETWNPPPGTPQAEIERICGRTHVRLYGLDFPKQLAVHGFIA
ncbi:MAG: class I SAM-dependent methyltransferase, partial [Caulobacteraceae bacterium]